MHALRNALGVIREFRRSYVTQNLIYYGLVLVGMALAMTYPSWHDAMLGEVGEAIHSQPLAPVIKAYTEGRLASAITKTFLVNFLAGSLLTIALPSLVIPFSGQLMGVARPLLWGVLFAPVHAQFTAPKVVFGILTGLLIFLEGQGYILALEASYIQSRLFVCPPKADTEQAHGYLAGLKRSLPVYLLVAIVLIVAAIYEATIAILVFPRLR
jgi:hypothetical protein